MGIMGGKKGIIGTKSMFTPAMMQHCPAMAEFNNLFGDLMSVTCQTDGEGEPGHCDSSTSSTVLMNTTFSIESTDSIQSSTPAMP